MVTVINSIITRLAEWDAGTWAKVATATFTLIGLLLKVYYYNKGKRGKLKIDYDIISQWKGGNITPYIALTRIKITNIDKKTVIIDDIHVTLKKFCLWKTRKRPPIINQPQATSLSPGEKTTFDLSCNDLNDILTTSRPNSLYIEVQNTFGGHFFSKPISQSDLVKAINNVLTNNAKKRK